VVESFGAYEVVARVAQGSTGVVYRARHVDLGRVAAVKVLSAALREVPGQLERMRAEAALLAGLDDPHIVEVYDFVEDPERVWIAEQWVEGASLERILSSHGRLSPEQSLGVVRGALMGLAYAHDRDLVHRDFSTGNVLADMAGTSMLVDFGLAAPVGGSGVLGTPAFLSPEVVRGEAAGKPSDVYSAAAVTFTLLTGQPPFPAGDVSAVLRAHLTTPAPLLEGFGGDLQDLLQRAMAKDPARRPPDAAAFLAELETAARRRFGAGWLERASIAGVVGSVVGLGAIAAGSTSTAGAAGVAGAPVAETVVVDTDTLTSASTGSGARAVGKGVGRVAGRSRNVLIALGTAAALFVVGGVAIAVNHASKNDSGTSSTTSPTSPSATPKPGVAGSPTSAVASGGTDFDVRGTLRVDDVKFNGTIGRHYQTTAASMHVSCRSGACTISNVRAPAVKEHSYLVRGLERTLKGAGPWVDDDGAIHSCSGRKLHHHFRVTLTITGTRVVAVAKGYSFRTPFSDPHFCEEFAGRYAFTGTKSS
jgi:hypothetical protein